MPKVKEKKFVDFPTKAQALLYVTTNPYTLETLDPKWRDDKEVMMAAIEIHGMALEHASDRLKADREVVVAAVKKEPRALTFAAKELRDDLEMRKLAYKKSVFIVDPIAWKVFEREDARMLRETIKTKKVIRNGKESVENVFDELGEPVFSESKTLVHPVYIKYKDFYNGELTIRDMMVFEKELIASKVSTVDEAIELLSTPDGARAFRYLPSEIREYRVVALKAVSMRGENLYYTTDANKADKEIVDAAIQNDPYSLIYAAKQFRDDFSYREKVYEKVGFFVANPTIRKRIKMIEKERTTGKIKRAEKEFKTRAAFEKFLTEELLKLIAADLTKEEMILVESGKRTSAREFKPLPYEKLTTELLIDFEDMLTTPTTRRGRKIEKLQRTKEEIEEAVVEKLIDADDVVTAEPAEEVEEIEEDEKK